MLALDQAFENWLPVVIPAFTVEQRDTRIAAIRKVADELTKPALAPLILLFYGNVQNNSVVDSVRQALNDCDDVPIVKNDAELSIFAAGVLFEILERGGKLAIATCLMLNASEFGGLRGANRIQDVISQGDHFLKSEGIRIREQSIEIFDLQRAFAVHAEKEEEDETVEDEPDDGTIPIEVIVDELGKFGTSVAQAITMTERRRKEESNILFWLISGRRRSDAQPLSKLKRKQAVLHLASDLAEQTEQIPGPVCATSLLRTLLEQCDGTGDETTVEACVGAIGTTDGSHFLSLTRTLDPQITPLSYALEKARENGWKKGWQTAFETQTLMSPSASRTFLEISEQFYIELLISRLFTEG